MRGPLARERARRSARTHKIVTRSLLAVTMTFFLLGAMYTDHQFLMTYGY